MNIRLSDRVIGEREPCFIIAEAGINHNGDINLAKEMIDTAKKAGADAVKFQTFQTGEIATRSAKKAEYQRRLTGKVESQYEMLEKLEITEGDFKVLFAQAQKEDILFLSSPFDKKSVDLLDSMGVAAFKIASGEITNLLLLEYIALKKKPVILSTGMATIDEIEEALATLRQNSLNQILLLHCVSAYPAKAEDMNLKVMETLNRIFQLPVGLSDHTLGIAISVAAVVLGACVIEKHFTLDKNLPGPDHKASLEPVEFVQMVNAIRDVEKAIGDGEKRLTKEEEENKLAVRRRIVAATNIPRGIVITDSMLKFKRSYSGLEVIKLKEVLGRITLKPIKQEEGLTPDLLGDKK
ncbi:N-acetylneuraminate synthase [Chloroflexota bacterium]